MEKVKKRTQLLWGYVIHRFYYDQFMNKTHVEGMQNIC